MKRLLLLLLCLILVPVGTVSGLAADTDTILGMTDKWFTASDLTELKYRLYVPPVDAPEDGFAVFIHLHGIGECGNDNQAQVSTGMELVQPLISKHRNDTIVIVPQSMEAWVPVAPAAGTYSVDAVDPSPYLTAVMELLAYMQQTYSIDNSRLYVAGLSMGAYGVWDLLARYPGVFAAAIPVCGGGDPTKAHLMADVAIRTYHSADDPIVPVTGTRTMVEALKRAGSTVQYTEYTNRGHNCWTTAFKVHDQISWLYKQTRSSQTTPDPNPGVPDYTLGDVDQNGVVTAADALEVLKSVVGKITLTENQILAADTDKNGTVAAADALTILQVVVGKIPPLK